MTCARSACYSCISWSISTLLYLYTSRRCEYFHPNMLSWFYFCSSDLSSSSRFQSCKQSSDHMEAWRSINRETENHERRSGRDWLTHTHTQPSCFFVLSGRIMDARLLCSTLTLLLSVTRGELIYACCLNVPGCDVIALIQTEASSQILSEKQQNFRKVMRSLKMSQMYNKCALFAICASVVSLNHISASQTASNVYL